MAGALPILERNANIGYVIQILNPYETAVNFTM